MSDFPYSPDPMVADAQRRARLLAGHLEQKEASMLRHGATPEQVRQLNMERGWLGWSPIPEDKFPKRKF